MKTHVMNRKCRGQQLKRRVMKHRRRGSGTSSSSDRAYAHSPNPFRFANFSVGRICRRSRHLSRGDTSHPLLTRGKNTWHTTSSVICSNQVRATNPHCMSQHMTRQEDGDKSAYTVVATVRKRTGRVVHTNRSCCLNDWNA
jgi:hypothetical protein